MKHRYKGPYEAIFKRIIDVILSAFALIVLSPVMIVTGLMVALRLGRPVLFSQQRPGRDEKIFKLYKFRSMTEKRDEKGQLLPDEERLTEFGKKLRSTSLDELPELFNILKGDMSLVGPRPLMVEYLPRYNEKQRRRHEVRPGLTGMAQVSGRNSLSWQERFKLDVEYVDNITFMTDIKILTKTVTVVLGKEGISSEDCETMEDFMGN